MGILKLEVGKTYLNTAGHQVKIKSLENDGFFYSECNTVYYSDGMPQINGTRFIVHSMCLVSEVVEPFVVSETTDKTNLTTSEALIALSNGEKITSDALKKGEYAFIDKNCDLISICADMDDLNINNILVEDNLRIYEEPKPTHIKLNKHEIQSGLNRVKHAEGLILQLPHTHEGRNTWLMNYGTSELAKTLRENRGLGWSDITTSAIKEQISN